MANLLTTGSDKLRMFLAEQTGDVVARREKGRPRSAERPCNLLIVLESLEHPVNPVRSVAALGCLGALTILL